MRISTCSTQLGNVHTEALYGSYNTVIYSKPTGYGVRAVAILPVDAVLDTKSTNGRTPETAYNIKWPKKPADMAGEIGKYVKYEPSGGSTTYSSTQAHNGNTATTVSRENLNWRILSVDGDSVKIISDPTTKTVTYKGAEGYNNAVKDLNDMCQTLYSHGTTYARSVNLEDFTTGQWKSSFSQASGSASPSSKTFPTIYQSEYSGSLGQSQQTQWYSGTYSGSTAKTTYWSGSIPSDSPLYSSGYYWLSSRCVDPGDINARFNLQYAHTSLTNNDLFHSRGSTYNTNRDVRAVVSLPSSVTFGNEQGTIEDPYTINWNDGSGSESGGDGDTSPSQSASDLEIGQYINYAPEGGGESYKSEQAHNGSGDQTMERETLNWRVLDIGTGDNGLEKGTVKIISDVSSKDITYKGAEGYNNIVKDLNDMCETLYSHGDTKARSVNLDDFTNKSQTYTAGSYSATCPTIYPQEKVAGGTLDQSEQNDWVTGSTTSTSRMGNNYWSGSLQNTDPLYSSKNYFLTSRCVHYDAYNIYYFRVQFRVWLQLER